MARRYGSAMIHMRSHLLATALLGLAASPLALLGFAAVPAAGAEQGAPVVVELFTSQGCSSCPPADAYLGELSKQPGVVALGFHVDYWDYIGWKDPFASPDATARQRGYSERLGTRYLYTPEIVVDGKGDATGSDRAAVSGLIESSRQAARKIAIRVSAPQASHYVVTLPAASYDGTATLWMAVFDPKEETAVDRGENEGSMARDFNAVRELRRVGKWEGKAETLEIGMEDMPGKGCAFLLQSDIKPGDGEGAIIGAALAEPMAMQ
jgi:hypothetical protein